MAWEDKIDVNLNQNIWLLVVGFAALGAAEHWCLLWLCRLSVIVSIGALISVAFTLFAYTYHYCTRKFAYAKTIKARAGKLHLGSPK
jgi:hypothetical protein